MHMVKFYTRGIIDISSILTLKFNNKPVNIGNLQFYFCFARYDGEPDEDYTYELLDDLESGDLEILPLDGDWLVGRRIEHRFKSEDDGEVCSGVHIN